MAVAPGIAPDEANGSVSPRKGYTRAPFDDWRKPTAGEDEDAWRGGGAGGGAGRRWNGGGSGWRSQGGEGEQFRRFGDREFVNGGPVNPKWKEPGDAGYRTRGGGGTRGGHHGSFAARAGYRGSGYRADNLPEWANDEDDEFGERGRQLRRRRQVPGLRRR